MHQDALPQMDDRAIGMIGNSLHYAAGLDTPANKAFVDAFAKKAQAPAVLVLGIQPIPRACGPRTAIEQIKGNVEDRDAFLKAMRTATIKAPRGTLKLDEYDNPIQNVYMTRIQKINHPVRWRRADQCADQNLRERLAVLDLEARGIPQARPL